MTSQEPLIKVATIEPHGYISAANVGEFQQQLTQAVTSQDHSALLIDMKRVEFLDSAGLMVLVSALRLAQRLGRRLGICSLAPSVRIIFELSQLDRAFEIFDNRDAFRLALVPTFRR